MGKRRPSSRRPLCIELELFEKKSSTEGFALDASQRQAAAALADTAEHGVYLWGPPGRGKTWLMDTYVAALPAGRTLRMHFHEFFRALHTCIVRHKYNLDAGLDDLLGQARVVCIDEFHVHDIGDAKLLERVLTALSERKIAVVATSNYPPDALLPNPLFHEAFVPTIALIKRTMTVVAVEGATDYRTTTIRHDSGFAAGSWVASSDQKQLRHLGLERPGPAERRSLEPSGRPIHALRADANCLWFTFADLCETATVPADYLELAQLHSVWVVSDIPDLNDAGPEAAQRFANLVDVLYDEDVEVTFLASTSFDSPHPAGRHPADVARLTSRLRRLRTEVRPAVRAFQRADGSSRSTTAIC